MTAHIQEIEAIEACRALFGEEVRRDREFLRYLQASGAKSAFRRQVKQTHPDRFADEAPAQQEKRAELFREVVRAYDLLRAFLQQRDRAPHPGAPPLRPQPAPANPGPPGAQGGRSRNRNGHYYSGTIPARPLQIGIYLYYRGFIPYQALIEALVWQRRQRPNLGDIAIRWGWLDDAAIRAIFRSRLRSGRFGEKAVRLGFLKPFQVQTLLHYQRSLQKRLGEFFVEQGYLSDQTLEQLAAELKAHNARHPSCHL